MQQIWFSIVHASDKIALVSTVCCITATALALFFRQKDRPNRRGFHRGVGITGIALLFFMLSGGAWEFGARVPVPPPSSGRPHCVNASTTIAGSTAMYSLVQAVAKEYMGFCPSAHITVVNGGGSEIGVSDVEDNVVETRPLVSYDCVCIGDSDVPATTFGQRYNNLDDHIIAAVQYVLIVDNQLGISNLTTDEIKNIYENGGTYANWGQVNYKTKLPIVRISRDTKSGTRITFDQYVLGGGSEKPPLEPADQVTSNDLVIQRMLQVHGSIGYVSLQTALAHQDRFTIVTIDGHHFSEYRDNSYTFWTLEHMYTNSARAVDSLLSYNLAKAFIDYMGNTDAVQNIIHTNSFLSVDDVSHILYTHY